MISTTTVAVVSISGLLVLVGGAGIAKVHNAEKQVKSASLVSTLGKDAQPEKSPIATAPKAATEEPGYVLGFTLKDIDGKDHDLAQYKGKVVLMVNVASQCGYTAQYETLQKLYAAKKDAGLVVLGFPANNFGSQEPGSEADIKQFCSSKFNVTFPMFSKISVKGDDTHPLYKKLAEQPKPVGGEPGWNFTKFLVDRSGHVVARYDSKVKPDAKDLTTKIDELLAAK